MLTWIHPRDNRSTAWCAGWIRTVSPAERSPFTNYIDLHAAEGISVQQTAEIIGVNRTYFSTEFSRKVGITPIDYIIKVRMTKARMMLLETAASITEIGYSLGYPTLFAFTRAFKKYFSLSPTEYRSQFKS